MPKKVLVVDDDVRVLRYLQQVLTELGDSTQILTASSPDDALEQVKAQLPDLVISDLRMPGMNGLQLLQKVREVHSSARLVLMTAYGTDEVQEAARRLDIYRFITKPFRNENLLSVARSALSSVDDIAISADGVLIVSDKTLVAITDILNRLRTEIRPEIALMADTSGHILTHIGTTMGLDLNALVALVAGSFATAAELDRIFDQTGMTAEALPDDEPLYITYQEGRNHDCYSANVGKDLFFSVVFKRAQAKNKVGMVWLYMRRTFQSLQKVILTSDGEIPPELSRNSPQTVTDTFQTLFKDDVPT